MQVIGFNFTRISAERFPEYKSGKTINNNIEFTSLDKDKIEVLKDLEAAKVSFKYALTYKDNADEKEIAPKDAEIIFEGVIILSLTKDESKELFKFWKKKELPASFRIPLFNLLIKKCAARALSFEEELNLPPHINIPQLAPKPKQE